MLHRAPDRSQGHNKKQMLQCPPPIWIICSWEKWGIDALSSFLLSFRWQRCISVCMKQSTCLVKYTWIANILLEIWHTWSNAFVSAFVSFISLFSGIQRAEMSKRKVIFLNSLIKICIHGCTTVRTANISYYFFIIASYPKANSFLWGGNSK